MSLATFLDVFGRFSESSIPSILSELCGTDAAALLAAAAIAAAQIYRPDGAQTQTPFKKSIPKSVQRKISLEQPPHLRWRAH